jgi:hypothetical protein
LSSSLTGQQTLKIVQLLGRSFGLSKATAQLLLDAMRTLRRRQAERIVTLPRIAPAAVRPSERIDSLAAARAGFARALAGLPTLGLALHFFREPVGAVA